MKRRYQMLCKVLVVVMTAGLTVQAGAPAEAKQKSPSLAKKKITLQVGEKKKIVIKNKRKKATYRFQTSKAKVKVNKKGVVTAKKVGKAKVTVREIYKKKNRKIGTVTVTIVKKKPVNTKQPDKTKEPGSTVTPAESKKPDATKAPESGLVYENHFEDGNLNGFSGRGSASVEINNADNHTGGGKNSLLCTGRSSTWHGARLDITNLVEVGSSYHFSAWVKQDSGKAEKMSCKIEYKPQSGETKYESVVGGGEEGFDCPSGEWVNLSGDYVMPENEGGISLYFESSSSDSLEFLVDDVEISGKKTTAPDSFQINDGLYKTMVSDSLLSTGNNARIKAAIEKAKSGEDVTLAYLGGSITEGANANPNSKCYAEVSANAFASAYGKDGGKNVHFINAGMSGTPSAIGVVRYQRDVLNRVENGTHPDVLFLEFSVNDYQEVTQCGAYEGLIRYALKNGTAVVLIFSVFQKASGGVVCEMSHRPYGEYYDLPMISMGNSIMKYFGKKGFYKWYFSDTLHPNHNGYQLMSDCIMNLFQKIDQEQRETEIDIDSLKPKKTDAYEGIRYVDASTDCKKEEAVRSVEAGGFSGTDSQVPTFQYLYNGKKGASWFPNNWMHKTSSGDAAWKMSVNCRTFMLVYKLSSRTTAGKVDLYVDGTKKETLSAYDKSGWNNGSVYVAFTGDKKEDHTIELRMANGSEAKEFTLLAVGYR